MWFFFTVEFDSRFLQNDEQSPFSGSEYKEFPYSLLRKKSEPDQEFMKNNQEPFVRQTYPTHFTTVYNTPDHFRSGYESKDDSVQQSSLPIFINNGKY